MRFVFIYTNEAHPSDAWPHHTSMEQKLRHARAMVARYEIARPMLVDALDGAVHRAYGGLPNMTCVIQRGRVVYRADWTDEQTLAPVLEQVLWEEAQRKAGKDLAPFWAEWAPQRVRDRPAFLHAMATEVGRRAVEEFIAAIEAKHGPRTAAPLRAWWDAHR